MQIYPIDLAEFTTKGAIKATLTQEGLCLGLNNPLRKHFHRYVDVINAYVFLTQKIHLPVKISFTINANNTGFHFLFGAGRITFNDDDNDGARMCNDIVNPSLKASRFNNNFVPKDKDTIIEIIYDYKFMQINVGGEERYFSTKEKYIKSKFTAGKNTEGFDIRFAIDQSEKVLIKQFSVTQYDEGETVPCIRPTKEEIIARNAAKLNTWYDWRVNFLAKCQPDENDKLRKIYIDLFDYINRNYIILFQENEIIDEPIKIDEACMKYLYDFALGAVHDDFKYKFIFEKIGLYKSDVLPVMYKRCEI